MSQNLDSLLEEVEQNAARLHAERRKRSTRKARV